jgi:hypothetical protein
MAKINFIFIDHKKDFPNYLLNEFVEIKVMLYFYDDATGPVAPLDITSDPNLTILSLDVDNFIVDSGGLVGGYKRILAKKEGSGVVKAIYIDTLGYTHVTSKQFLCQGNFFKTNYLSYLFSSFNKGKIESNQYVKTIFDTLMDMMDILYAYNEDLKIINSFSKGKSKFLNALAKNVGFDRIDFTDYNTSKELVSDTLFRDLLGNMLDLLSIRGTNLAYELFFGALGYNISISEFWYDDEGYLVDINPLDPNNSTFYRYKTDGTPVDLPQVPVLDPRGKQTTGSSVFKNNKSNYARVNLTTPIDPNLDSPSTFSVEKNLIIKKYLEFLRPAHIQYMTEIIPGATVFDTVSGVNDENILFGKQYTFPPISSSGTTVTGSSGVSGVTGSSGSSSTDFMSEYIGSFVSGIGQSVTFLEQFVIGFKNLFLDEFSTYIRWDIDIKWDSDNFFWDTKGVFDENINITTL